MAQVLEGVDVSGRDEVVEEEGVAILLSLLEPEGEVRCQEAGGLGLEVAAHRG